MQRVRSGELPFCKLDVLHRHNLDRVLAARGLHDVPEAARRAGTWPAPARRLARRWRRACSACALKTRLAPCSNGNISLMVDLARRNSLPWDAILGARLARDYKPQPVVYRCAVDAFVLQPDQVLMVAAHSGTGRGCGRREPSPGPTSTTGPARAKPPPAWRSTGDRQPDRPGDAAGRLSARQCRPPAKQPDPASPAPNWPALSRALSAETSPRGVAGEHRSSEKSWPRTAVLSRFQRPALPGWVGCVPW